MKKLNKVLLLLSAILIVSLPYYGPILCDSITEYFEQGHLFSGIQQPIYYKSKFSLYKEVMSDGSKHEDTKETSLDSVEFVLMKKKLLKAVMKYNHKVHGNKDYAIDLGKYGIQYVAFVNECGNKQVWIHGFDTVNYARIKKYSNKKYKEDFYARLVDGFDGGNNYFSTIINLTKEQPAEIVINGVI